MTKELKRIESQGQTLNCLISDFHQRVSQQQDLVQQVSQEGQKMRAEIKKMMKQTVERQNKSIKVITKIYKEKCEAIMNKISDVFEQGHNLGALVTEWKKSS